MLWYLRTPPPTSPVSPLGAQPPTAHPDHNGPTNHPLLQPAPKCTPPQHTLTPGLSLRGGGGMKKVRKANRNERSRSLFHGQDMGKTQDHRNSIE